MESASQQVSIQSKDHEKLLNVIDDLRSQGISRFIDLPQIIVCGDQSSGKSSVLEAVSGLRFPSKDSLCTRFGTELILRRSPETTSSVSIVADANRSDEEKQRLKDFKSDVDIYEKLGQIIEEAGKIMGLDGTSKNFSSDVLRIELSGPGQPHLTLVDLPGLFHSGSKSQSDADAEAVKALVTSYMSKSRSIILAVISAKNDFNNQIVTRFAKDYDPEGVRTLGIITKPDTLPIGSDSERQFLELAENKDVNFGLGWHVLKNRDYENRNCSNEERDRLEKEFFSKGIWTCLSPLQVGIESLRPRLSKVLQGQILRELPGLMKDVGTGIHNCQSRLQLLGASRGTYREQRMHLHSVSDVFTLIIKEAVRGRYDNKYFGDAATEDGYVKRIRAITSNMIQEFSEDVRKRGHLYEVVPEADKESLGDGLQPHQETSDRPPYKVTKETRIASVKELIKRNRGQELATISKEENVTALFHEQCSPWVKIVKHHAEEIFTVVRTSVHLALEYVCDQTTREGILSRIVNPGLTQVKVAFEAAIEKVLHQHINGHPITYNHYLSETLQKMRTDDREQSLVNAMTEYLGFHPKSKDADFSKLPLDPMEFLKALAKSDEPEMTTFACTEVLNTMEAYYKVALKNFVDDFAIYAVEQDLLVKLKTLFTTSTVLDLDEETIEDIAGETEESKIERATSEKKLATLEKALEVLERLDRPRGHNK